MKKNITKNRSWLLTGLETVLLGVFFLFVPDILDSGDYRAIFNLFDTTLPAIFLIVVGTFTIVNAAFEVEPNWHRVNVFILEFIWSFYTATFVIHDFQLKGRVFISLISILFFVVALRIFFESWLGDPSDFEEANFKHET